MAEDPMADRSGNPIPPEYGRAKPYFDLALKICLPVGCVAGLLATIAPSYSNGPRLCQVIAQIGVAYAFGSNVWLFRYGSKSFKVCKEHSKWLGKEAFSTIQAACFPEFFALQVSACLLVVGGHVAVSGFDFASAFILTATAFGCVNLLVLGPMTMPRMIALYSVSPDDITNSESKEDPLLPVRQAKKRFGMIHGISMLVDLLALLATLAYMVVATPSPA